MRQPENGGTSRLDESRQGIEKAKTACRAGITRLERETRIDEKEPDWIEVRQIAQACRKGGINWSEASFREDRATRIRADIKDSTRLGTKISEAKKIRGQIVSDFSAAKTNIDSEYQRIRLILRGVDTAGEVAVGAIGKISKNLEPLKDSLKYGGYLSQLFGDTEVAELLKGHISVIFKTDDGLGALKQYELTRQRLQIGETKVLSDLDSRIRNLEEKKDYVERVRATRARDNVGR